MRRERSTDRALQLVEQAQQELLGIRRRITTLEAFETELNRVTRGEPFTIMNELIWVAMIDARDMLLIHFAQWILSARGSAGLFGKLRQCKLSNFYVPTKPSAAYHERVNLITPASEKVRAELERDLACETHAGRRALFAEVFPDAMARGGAPNHEDLDRLQKQFESALCEVVADRNQNRAHPPYGPAPKKASARMLGFGDLRNHVEWADDFLNKLRLLIDQSRWMATDPQSQAEETARDLVDALLLGGRRRMDFLTGLSEAAYESGGRYAWQYRDALYEAMWSQRRTEDDPFNDPAQLRDREGYRLFVVEDSHEGEGMPSTDCGRPDGGGTPD